MKHKNSIQSHIGPSMGASFKNWMKMLIINGSFALKYIHRVTIVNLLSAIGIPFRAYEHWKFDKIIKHVFDHCYVEDVDESKVKFNYV